MFFRLTPFAITASEHPLFQLESRRVTNYTDFPTLRANSLIRLGWVVAVCVFLLAGYIALNMADRSFDYYYSASQAILSVVSDFTLIVAFIGVLANAYLDFISLNASMTAINSEVLSGRWDLLRLTGMREGYFIVSKHGVAQLKAWRAVVSVVGLRLVASISALILLVIASFQLFASIITFNDAMLVLGSIATLFLFGVVFCIEPIWRMRMTTAIGLYVSARTRSPISSPLMGFAFVFAIWCAQFIIFVSLGGVIGMLAFPLMFVIGYGSSFVLPLLGIFLALTVYGFYTLIQQWSLRSVGRLLARLET